MSKIGRMPIDLGDVKIEVKGKDVHYSGKLGSGVYVLPVEIITEIADNKLLLKAADERIASSRDFNRIWGLHRALLSNAIVGVKEGFTKDIQIVGLGFKAVQSGNKLTFSLGYSHKIDFELPKEVSIQIDKTGQKLKLTSVDKQKLGQACSHIKSLRKTEPYKGTGIKLSTDVIIRKAGKTKA